MAPMNGNPMLKDVLLRVRPAGEGWMVDCGREVAQLHFLSGGRAEAQAHALAQTLARTGADARVLVHDRAERLVGSTRYFAELSDG